MNLDVRIRFPEVFLWNDCYTKLFVHGVLCSSKGCFTAQKMTFSIKNFFSKCDQICGFGQFTEEIPNGKLHLHFLCSAWCMYGGRYERTPNFVIPDYQKVSMDGIYETRLRLFTKYYSWTQFYITINPYVTSVMSGIHGDSSNFMFFMYNLFIYIP